MKRKRNKENKQPWVLIVIVVFVLAMLAIASYVTFDVMNKKYPQQPNTTNVKVTSFQECADAGYAVQMSYPGVCVDGEGNRFIQQD